MTARKANVTALCCIAHVGRSLGASTALEEPTLRREVCQCGWGCDVIVPNIPNPVPTNGLVAPLEIPLEVHRSCPQPARRRTLRFIIDVFQRGRAPWCSSSFSLRLASQPQQLSSVMLRACRVVYRNITRLPCPFNPQPARAATGSSPVLLRSKAIAVAHIRLGEGLCSSSLTRSDLGGSHDAPVRFHSVSHRSRNTYRRPCSEPAGASSRNVARLPCPIRHSSCKSCNGVTVMHYLVMTTLLNSSRPSIWEGPVWCRIYPGSAVQRSLFVPVLAHL